MPDTPPLDDLLGKKVHVDGQDWTIQYSDATKGIALVRPLPGAFEGMLKALRDGAAVLTNDPAEIAAQPLPTEQVAASREWLFLDAVITGARQHGTLAPDAVELLEARLLQLTEALRRFER